MIGATFFLYFMLHSGAFINRIFAVLNDEFFSFGIFISLLFILIRRIQF